jgi:ketosteroid isomerase-like protein
MPDDNVQAVRQWCSRLSDGDPGVELCAAGIELDELWASIVSVRDGEIVRAEGYAARRRASRAAGLPD